MTAVGAEKRPALTTFYFFDPAPHGPSLARDVRGLRPGSTAQDKQICEEVGQRKP